MKLGILGGSFNPVHKGHIHLAEAAISELKLDRVVFVPAYQSPFKIEAHGMQDNTAERINVLASAIVGDPRFAIDDCEIRREGVSYTVHTLEDIIARYMPEGKPYLIIGDDLAADFPNWRNSQHILELAEIVIGKREIKSEELGVRNEEFKFPHIKLNNEIIDISSSKIRQLAGEGKDYSTYIPSVISVSSVVIKIENIARETLSQPRFLHSRQTALLAYDMCKRFGLEPQDGYLAGIAHDLAKQFEPKELLRLAKTDGEPITSLEKDKLGLLHGRAGAVLLRERFSIHNKDVLEAVKVHTAGSENMGQLAKVIYIADKLEVSRNIENPKTLDEIASLRKMCYTAETLDEVFFTVLNKTVSKLKSRELDLSEDTLRLLKKMQESFPKEKKS